MGWILSEVMCERFDSEGMTEEKAQNALRDFNEILGVLHDINTPNDEAQFLDEVKALLPSIDCGASTFSTEQSVVESILMSEDLPQILALVWHEIELNYPDEHAKLDYYLQEAAAESAPQSMAFFLSKGGRMPTDEKILQSLFERRISPEGWLELAKVGVRLDSEVTYNPNSIFGVQGVVRSLPIYAAISARALDMYMRDKKANPPTKKDVDLKTPGELQQRVCAAEELWQQIQETHDASLITAESIPLLANINKHRDAFGAVNMRAEPQRLLQAVEAQPPFLQDDLLLAKGSLQSLIDRATQQDEAVGSWRSK